MARGRRKWESTPDGPAPSQLPAGAGRKFRNGAFRHCPNLTLGDARMSICFMLAFRNVTLPHTQVHATFTLECPVGPGGRGSKRPGGVFVSFPSPSLPGERN